MIDRADSPVIFQRRAGGREVAILGIIEVGDIHPVTAGRVSFCWSLNLPFVAISACAMSIEAARGELRRKIEDWLDAAALAPIARTHDGEIRAYRDWDDIKRAVRT